jgi:hypothetical protein
MPGGSCRTELGVSGTRFTINGELTFLLGISFYGALGEPEELMTRDLDEMKHYGFNWFRVWATWSAFGNNVSAVDNEGNPREPYLSKLRRLVEEADERRMIVDITLSRGDTVNIPPRLKSTEDLKRAAATLLESLREYGNWYLDMANERNVEDSRFVSFEELREIRNHVKQVDPKRLVTASHSRDIPEDDLREYLLTDQVDFITPHRPRRASSADETEEMTRRYIDRMRLIGRLVPVHYQEPFRRGFNPKFWEPKAEDFIRDLEGARRGGAAGWCLHNGDRRDRPDRRPRRSFDLRDGRLFGQLDSEERKVLDYILSLRAD